jgi:CRP/FNR family transcriptional regulator, cyclic AMP receptor protein
MRPVNSLVELLSDEQRLDFVRHTTERNFARNEVVFHEGDPADSMHIVEKGLFVARSSSTLGHVLIVNVFRPGSVFGELALLRTDPVRSATVAAIRPGRTRLLRRVDLERLRSGPTGRQLDQFLLTALADQNLTLTAQLIELLFTPTSKRIQRQLLHLHELGIVEDGDGWMRLSQDELAMLTATTRATVNRVLRDLERRRIVDLGRGRSRIIDAVQLTRLSR